MSKLLRWFNDAHVLQVFLDANLPVLSAQDAWVAKHSELPGWCDFCGVETVFQVDVGVRLGEHPNLREGMLCRLCGLNNRTRQLATVAIDLAGSRPRKLLLEALSPLYKRLSLIVPDLEGSEYFGVGTNAGENVAYNGRLIRHESLLGLSMPDASLDLLIHNDVLEHVSDLDAALRESCRVLAPGGATVFAVPFFPFLFETEVRGRLHEDGIVEHLLPAEYHGDPLNPEGVYTFYHIGMDLFERARKAGFRRFEAGLATDSFLGHPTNNYRYGLDGLVPAIVFRGLV